MKKLLLILLSFLIISCGARKTQKTEVSKNETTETTTTSAEIAQVETSVKTEVSTIENKEDSSETEVTTIIPIDATKPAYFSYCGKTYNLGNSYFKKERIIKTGKSNKATNHIADIGKKVNNSKTTQMNNSVVKKNLTTEKQTEKENSINWWWLIIPLCIFAIIIWLYRKYKDQIWFIS